jgi:hypothetical protein
LIDALKLNEDNVVQSLHVDNNLLTLECLEYVFSHLRCQHMTHLYFHVAPDIAFETPITGMVFALANFVRVSLNLRYLRLELPSSVKKHTDPLALDALKHSLMWHPRLQMTDLIYFFGYEVARSMSIQHLFTESCVGQGVCWNFRNTNEFGHYCQVTLFAPRTEVTCHEGLFQSLPDEMVVAVFARAGARGVSAVAGTCARLRRVAVDYMVTAGVVKRTQGLRYFTNLKRNARRVGSVLGHQLVRAIAANIIPKQ